MINGDDRRVHRPLLARLATCWTGTSSWSRLTSRTSALRADSLTCWCRSGCRSSTVDWLSMDLSLKTCLRGATSAAHAAATAGWTGLCAPAGSEQQSFNPRVVGSIPTGPTALNRDFMPRADLVARFCQWSTKAVLAQQMLGRALDAGVPAAWITADEAYGQDYRSAPGASNAGSATSSPSPQPTVPLPLDGPVLPRLGSRRADDLVSDALRRRSSGAAAATARKARDCSTGRSPRYQPVSTPHPAGAAGCWSAAKSSPRRHAPQARSLSWRTTCAPARPAPPTTS
jgi:hypothetical protein